MTAELAVRQFQTSDADGVTTLWEEALPSSQPWNDPKTIICRKRLRSDQLFFVGEIEGRIVATVIAGYDGIRGWIYAMAVSSICRRQGIGRKMLAAAEAALYAEGCPKVNLQVRGSNRKVIDFYRSCGYVIEDRASLGKQLRTDSDSIVDPVPPIRVNDDIDLTPIVPDDHSAYLKHLNQTTAFHERMGLMPYPYTDIDAEQWLSKVAVESLEHNHCRNWAIRTSGGELIGGAGLVDIGKHEKAEIGYWLAEPYWGRGIMTDVVRCLSNYAFEQYQLRRIYARAFTSNPASARVLEKAGFEHEGTLRSHVFRDGKSYDVAFFGLMRSA